MTTLQAETVAALIGNRADDDAIGLVHGDREWTWREVCAEAAMRAAWLRESLGAAGPPHVGLLLPNVPEYVFQIFGAALAGTCVVGLNSTRRGEELARDIAHTQCQLVLSDDTFGHLVPGALRVDDEPWSAHRDSALAVTDELLVEPSPDTLLFLIFTSGSTSAPKAARCSQRRLAAVATQMGFRGDDALYCPMPLAHGNALSSTLFPALASGARLVLRDRFSATAWLDDVRTYGVTFTNTVGRALGYILATPPSAHDRDHRLKFVLAPEASPRDMAEFGKRFGVRVFSGYGSSEGGIALMPARPGSLGTAPPGAQIAVVDEGGNDCETALLDADGRLCNAGRAIGELVRKDTAGAFEGYWDNPEADADRLRGGWFWSGDLAYRDADGVFWFAGRVGDWLRVDSENFAAAPVERILSRFDDAAAVAVVGVPDPQGGDQVLAVLEPIAGRDFDPQRFSSFLAAQPDLGTKWAPRFVRVTESIPVVGHGKIDKKPLRRDAWLTTDPIWWRPPRTETYVPMTRVDRDALRAEFAAHGRPDAHPNL
ncbi:AMP-binding protein [Mycobacterium sp. OTB74]|uniref:AMP-binding protein n=1 Tax=Mycobacterium sp. OTB74 TaxID=1853452 RepID=UPI00247646A9|nr:AMP-binding protein [Mycobacterium sp. OTB74]MDH6246742.1 fatty-acyl-CoA synthase [Mycobacterium sp. OTB74]